MTVTIYTDEHGRDYYVDGQAITQPIIVRDWRWLWLRKRHDRARIVGWKPIRVYLDR